MPKSSIVRKARFQEVIQLPLLPEHDAKIDELRVDTEGLMSELTRQIANGYSFKFMTDERTAAVACQMYGDIDGLPNSGKMIYGNGDDWDAALAVVLFKHLFLAKGGEWGIASTKTSAKYS